MKALDRVYNWFVRGATIPIEPSWLPVPCSGSMYDKRQEESPETWRTQWLWEDREAQHLWNYKLLNCPRFSSVLGTYIHMASFWTHTKGDWRGPEGRNPTESLWLPFISFFRPVNKILYKITLICYNIKTSDRWSEWYWSWLQYNLYNPLKHSLGF